MKKVIGAVGVIGAIMLNACGQKGDLYLPQPKLDYTVAEATLYSKQFNRPIR